MLEKLGINFPKNLLNIIENEDLFKKVSCLIIPRKYYILVSISDSIPSIKTSSKKYNY
jgi:hypothetical protein